MDSTPNLNDAGSSSGSSSSSRPQLERGNSGQGAKLGRGAAEPLSEYQLYQRFRLKMVQIFGSLSAALFELGADPETGRLTWADFANITTENMGLLSQEEAVAVFSHITNASPTDMHGGICYPRNFGISNEEWKLMVSQKSQPSNPFASGPSGGSMGAYHRNINLSTLSFPSTNKGDVTAGKSIDTVGSDTLALSSTQPQSPPSPGGGRPRGSPKQAQANQMKATAGSSSGLKTRPWQQRHQPWSQSLFCVEPYDESDVERYPGTLRSYPTERKPSMESKFRGLSTPTATSPRWRTEDFNFDWERRRGEPGWSAYSCPTRRREMEPGLCEEQVETWWPYQGRNPPRRRNLLALAERRVAMARSGGEVVRARAAGSQTAR